jgi:hypothetical protein
MEREGRIKNSEGRIQNFNAKDAKQEMRTKFYPRMATNGHEREEEKSERVFNHERTRRRIVG